MVERDDIEKALADLTRERDEAGTEATHARDRLARIASGITPLEELNAGEVEGAADDFAAAVRRLQLLDRVRATVRKLLM